jgi:hypothetical protein
MLSVKRKVAPGLVVLAALAVTAATGAGAEAAGGWKACSVHRSVSGTKISRVHASGMPCSEAAGAIQRGRVLLSPGGPIFSTSGYRCTGKNLHPTSPSPSQLPALIHCTRGHGHAFRFRWTWS